MLSSISAKQQQRFRLLASTFLVPIFYLGVSAAEAQQSAAPVTDLPTIVVSATTIDTPANQIASSVTVITAKDLETLQRRTVTDALQTVPGLNIVQNGGPGGQTSIFTRGTNSNHTKILIDGIDVSDSSNPGRTFDLGQLLTSDIERIEVLRGPQSGLYGADALGGVISIFTKKGEGPPRITASIEGGSQGTFNQNAGFSGAQDRINYAFNVAHFQSTNTPVTPLELLPPGQRAIGNYYDNMTYSGRLGVDVTDNFAVNVVARYTDSILRFTGDATDPITFATFPSATQSTQYTKELFTRAEGVWSLFDGRFKNYFGVNYSNTSNFNLMPPDAFGDPTSSQNTGDRLKYDWRGVAAILPGQTLVMGADHETETLNTSALHAENTNKGAYIELQSEFAKQLFLVSNVRFDENDSYGDHTTYRIAPAYIVPGTDTKLKASYGTGFKAPTLSQLFVSFPDFGFFANPNLKPEESTGYDVGFEQPIGDRFRFGATYFHNDIRNLVNTVIIDPTAFISTLGNVDKARTEGVETFAAFNVTDKFRLRGDYTFTRAVDESTGLELLRRPQDKASLTAIWNPYAPLTVSATVLYVGSFVDASRDFTIPRLIAPGYTVVNLTADYIVNDQVKVFGRIDNLFDERYQDPTGFLRPGFGIFGGIRFANYGVR
jgi:vitamin B12 transporter